MLAKALLELNTIPCLNCGENMIDKSSLCNTCFKALPFVLTPDCPACGSENDGIFDVCPKCLKEEKRPWKKAVAIMRMEGTGQELIHRFKYGNETSIARIMGELSADKIQKKKIDFDCIVPVPLHWTRRLTRGYNQTELFASIIAKQTKKPLTKLLKRVKYTKKQASLERKKRLKNLDGAFAVRKPKNCENRKILLVDDVMTTGTTLSIAAAALLKAGAAEVNVLVLLRA
jgi:competence protein ComFC